jgi:trk system potassium uptake protein TrkA
MKRFAVIGLGRFGYNMARALFEEGNEVIAVDRSQERVQAMEAFCTSAIVQDATDSERLKMIGLDEIDAAVVSTGSRISSSILICYHLKSLDIKEIIVRAEDDDHGRILSQLGATQIIRPARDMAYRLARQLTRPNILDFLPLEQDYSLIQIDPPKPLIGKSLREVGLRKKYGVYVIAVKELVPEKMTVVPPADFVIKDSDILIMIGKIDDINKIKELK